MEKFKQLNPICYVIGTVFCALGVSLCTKSGFGLSMIGAVPYIVHVWLVQKLSWFSQGTSEYFVQGFILILTGIIVGKFKAKWLLSFLSAVFSGLCIDGWLYLLGGNAPYTVFSTRLICFISGMIITSFAIAVFFRTRMPLQAYELAVVEISDRYGFDKSKVKYVNDIIYLILSFSLSLILFHELRGVGIATIVMAVLNAPLIKMFTIILDKLNIPK